MDGVKIRLSKNMYSGYMKYYTPYAVGHLLAVQHNTHTFKKLVIGVFVVS